MEVRCGQCGTEYEFEEDKLTEAGVTVRCTECSYVFKVRRRTVAVTEPVNAPTVAPTSDKPWMVRRPNGDVFTFKELTTLQAWIVERKVGRADEISRSGDVWKRLGNIAELATFFQVVEQADRAAAAAESASGAGSSRADASEPPAAAAPGASTPPSVAAPAAPTPPSAVPTPPPAAPAPGSTSGSAGPAFTAPSQAGAPAVPPPAAAPPPSPVAPAAPAPVAAAPARPPAPEPAWASAAAIQPPPAQPAESWDDDPLSDDDDDDFAEFKRGGAGKWVLALVVLLAAGAGGLWYYAPDQVQAFVGSILGKELSDVAKGELAAARAAWSRDTVPGYTEAAAAYGRALAAAEGVPFPDAHAGLAETRVAWALALTELAEEQAAKVQAGIAAAREGVGPAGEAAAPGAAKAQTEQAAAAGTDGAKPDGANSDGAKSGTDADAEALAAEAARVDALRAEAVGLLEAAFTSAQAALKDAPDAPGSLRAMAAYYVAMDAGQQLDPILEKALAQPGADKDPVLAWIRGLAFLGDDASLDSAVRHLQGALELDPGLLQARHALARALVQQGSPDKALVQARKVVEKSADHTRAQALIARLEADKAAAAEPEVPEAPAEPAQAEAPAEPEVKKPRPPSYDGLLRQAYAQRNRGRVEAALDLYGKAKDLKPDRAEPYAGQGYCYIEMRAWPAAVGSFEQALEHNPRYGEAIIGLAEAYKAQNKKAQAKKWYQKYLEILPDGPEARVAETNLERM